MSNKVAVITKKGLSESFSIVERDIPKPKNNEVLIKVDYVGLNRCDLFFSLGRLLPIEKFPNVAGFEASGTLVEFGSEELKNSNGKFKIGDKVSVVYGQVDHNKYGTFAEYFVFPIEFVVKNNELVNSKDMSANWISYLTAYYGLAEFAKVKKDDYVLITAGSAGTSLASISIAKFFGAKTIVTSRSDKKKQQILGYGADHFIALDDKNNDVVKQVNEITNGKGVNIIFDAVSGPGAEKLFETTAPFAKVIFYGFIDQSGPTIFPVPLGIGKFLTVKALNCYEYLYQEEYKKKGIEFLNTNFHHFKSIVGKEFVGINSIVDAFKFLESNDLFGKVVVKINQNSN